MGASEAQFPAHEEARMLRTGLDFFKFVPGREERPEEWFNRFDEMLDEANRVAHLGLSIAFQSWMLLSLLQLSLKKSSELLTGVSLDPIDVAEVRGSHNSTDVEVADLYWTMRRAVRRYRVAKGKFGPRRKGKGGKIRRRFQRFGKIGCRAKKGFYVCSAWISLEAGKEELEAFCKGRKGGKSSG